MYGSQSGAKWKPVVDSGKLLIPHISPAYTKIAKWSHYKTLSLATEPGLQRLLKQRT